MVIGAKSPVVTPKTFCSIFFGVVRRASSTPPRVRSPNYEETRSALKRCSSHAVSDTGASTEDDDPLSVEHVVVPRLSVSFYGPRALCSHARSPFMIFSQSGGPPANSCLF
jgi:hypothetical protein